MKRAYHHTLHRTPAADVDRIVFSDLVRAVDAGEILVSPFARHVQRAELPPLSAASDETPPLLTFCACSNGITYLVGGVEHYLSLRAAPDAPQYVLSRLVEGISPHDLYAATCTCNAYRLPAMPHSLSDLSEQVVHALARYSHTRLLLDDPTLQYTQRGDNISIAAAVLLAAWDAPPCATSRSGALQALARLAGRSGSADGLASHLVQSDEIFIAMADSFSKLSPSTARYARNARFMCALAYVLAGRSYSCDDIAHLCAMLFSTKCRNRAYGQISADGDSVRANWRRINYIRDCLSVRAWTLAPDLAPDNLIYADNRRYVCALLRGNYILVPLGALSPVERAVLSGVSHDPARYFATLKRYQTNLARFGCAV